jgi:hypothetical protein
MNKFLVLKYDDIDKALDNSPYIGNYLDDLTSEIREIRYNEGRNTRPEYIVINQDETYANEVIEILKRNGHWE